MSRGGNKKKNAQVKIAQLEIKKRNGLIVAVAVFVALAVVIALKLSFEAQGAAWAQSPIASLGLFILAIVAAGVAGWGTRTWKRSRDEIRTLQGKFKK